MRNRSAVIIVQNGRVVLIKRVRDHQTYYVFPGGGIESGETPEQAAEREAFEELGVEVSVGNCIAEVEYEGIQYFFEAQITGGAFGSGQGDELTDTTRNRGTYLPMLIDAAELPSLDVRPENVAVKIISHFDSGNKLK